MLLLLLLLPAGLSLSFLPCAAAPPPLSERHARSIRGGISNQGAHADKPYVTAGDHAYLIGTQDGGFPDMGWHARGEMGGLWLHPIKLIDGFWATVEDSTAGSAIALSHAVELITYPYANRLRYGAVLESLAVERFEWSADAHDGLIVQYRLENAAARPRPLTFVLAIKTDLRPVWFSDHLGIEDARDTVVWDTPAARFVARDLEHPWFCVIGAVGSVGAARTAPPLIATAGLGAAAAIRCRAVVAPRGATTLTFVFAGSARDERAAAAAFDELAGQAVSLLEAKKEHYLALVERERIRIPDPHLQEVYDWVRINMEWLVRDVPGIGRGLGAGLMDYPWWFGTETYSLQALIASGDAELAKQTLRLLESQSMKNNGNGRIVHEVTTNGAIVNPGNTQETAQWVLTTGRLVEWTGDFDFAREMYPAMKRSLAWLLGDMDRNRDLFPEGYGIMEVYGLKSELIDVAVYTQEALAATARVASALGDASAAAQYQALASRLLAAINQSFWAEAEGSYADFFGTRADAVSAAEGAIRQIELKGIDRLTESDRAAIGHYRRLKETFSTLQDGSRGWLTNKNWVISTPLETGIAPRERAITFLEKVRRENCGPYGPFLSAVERDREMTIATGVQAVAEANYGRTDQALEYMNMIGSTFSRVTPGSISEMMPDYGCFTIAWTAYGVVVPLITHVFGVRAQGLEKSVVFDPHLPTGWEDMSLSDLPIGTNVVSFARAKTARGIEYTIEGSEDGWTYVLVGPEVPGTECSVNGRRVVAPPSGIRLTGRTNRVVVPAKPAARH